MPVPNGTLTFDEVCEEVCRNTTIEEPLMKAAVEEYMKAVRTTWTAMAAALHRLLWSAAIDAVNASE